MNTSAITKKRIYIHAIRLKNFKVLHSVDITDLEEEEINSIELRMENKFNGSKIVYSILSKELIRTLATVKKYFHRGSKQDADSLMFNGNYKNIHCYNGNTYFGNEKSENTAKSNIEKMYEVGVLDAIGGSGNRFKLSEKGAKEIIKIW